MKLAAFKFVRAMERHLPLPLLRASLWPLVQLHCLREGSLRHEMAEALQRTPQSWTSGIDIHQGLIEERRRYHYSRFMNCWPDRWREFPWRERINADQVAKLPVGKPLVIATLHVGRMWMMHYALRNWGINAATLIGLSLEQRSETNSAKDRLVKGTGPTVFSRSGLKDACKFVRAGNSLVVAMDMPSEQMVTVDFGGGSICLSTGAVRLAQANGAMLAAGLILETAPWRYEIRLSDPFVCGSDQEPEEAMQRLAVNLADMVSGNPLQCGVETLRQLR